MTSVIFADALAFLCPVGKEQICYILGGYSCYKFGFHISSKKGVSQRNKSALLLLDKVT